MHIKKERNQKFMRAASKDRTLRIVFAATQGDVANTFRQWKQGHADTSVMSNSISGEFFEVCRQLHARALVIATCPKKDHAGDEQIRVLHRPIPWRNKGGLLFHLGQLWNGLRMIISTLWFRADVLLVEEGTQWITLMPLAWLGVKIIPDLRCAFWPKGYAPKGRMRRWQAKTAGWFWRWGAAATVGISPECMRQVEQLSGRPRGRLFVYVTQYDHHLFGRISPVPPQIPGEPFRMVFAGRVVPEKGVFHLLEMAKRLDQRYPKRFAWDICGRGRALDALRSAVQEAGLQDQVILHGFCEREAMFEIYRRARVFVVPATPNFAEGLTRSVVEGILVGRPVVTNPLTHCGEVFGNAIIQVPPEDIEAYCAAIEKLANDESYYRTVCEAGMPLRAQFFDERLGWGATVKRAIEFVTGGGKKNRSVENEGISARQGELAQPG